MDVELPDTGCNILHSSSAFYNYSNDGRTRQDWQIFDGVAHKISETTSTYGYTYTGTCLNTGDLVYKPELKEVFFPLTAVFVALFILVSAYKLILSMWWRKR